MTTAARDVAEQTPVTPATPVDARLSFDRLLRSEWLKLKTLRSTWIALGAAAVVLVLAAGLIANHMHGVLAHPSSIHDPEDRNVLTTPLHGFGLTQLIIGVLGVLAVTGEYATGMIRATFSAVPKRLPVLWAKLIVFGTLGFVAMLVTTLAAFFTAQAVLGTYSIGLSAPHALRVVVALAGYLTLVGLLGMGLGFIVRSTAGGIASLVGLVLVLPGILAAFNSSWANNVSHYVPLQAGLAMFNDTPSTGGDLSPGAGTAVMIAWVMASVIAAAVLVVKRDA
jgi:ABC-type transport system involved in multi-copper enzyme maturation permease subunit